MKHTQENDPLLSSTEAARLLGVHSASIKRWSDQGKIQCLRTPGGHRRFLKSEIEALNARDNPDNFRQNLLRALISGKQLSAEAILLEQWGELGRWEHVGEAVGIMLEEMGKAWSAGRMKISEEHIATETLLRSFTRIQTMIPQRPTSPVCALATAPGDEHTLGLAISELVLAEHDWQTLWLGRFSPIDTLAEMITRPDVNMLAVSASAFSSTPDKLSEMLCRLGPLALASNTTIVLGGSGSWPKDVFGTHRVNSYVEFGKLLRDLKRESEAS